MIMVVIVVMVIMAMVVIMIVVVIVVMAVTVTVIMAMTVLIAFFVYMHVFMFMHMLMFVFMTMLLLGLTFDLRRQGQTATAFRAHIDILRTTSYSTNRNYFRKAPIDTGLNFKSTISGQNLFEVRQKISPTTKKYYSDCKTEDTGGNR